MQTDDNGLFYMRERYYNPELGRFINEDPFWNPENMVYGEPSTYPIPNISAIMQSGNLYVYAVNNPIKFVDPNGCKILLSSDISHLERAYYYAALHYLMQSDTFRTLWETLENSDEPFIISYTTGTRITYDASARTIYWNPLAGLVLSDKKSIMSPSMPWYQFILPWNLTKPTEVFKKMVG